MAGACARRAWPVNESVTEGLTGRPSGAAPAAEGRFGALQFGLDYAARRRA